jgi:hypothetical protein
LCFDYAIIDKEYKDSDKNAIYGNPYNRITGSAEGDTNWEENSFARYPL